MRLFLLHGALHHRMVRSSTLLRSLKKDRIRKKKLHGAGNRLETGPEIAKRLQLAREKAQRRATRETGEAAEAAETQAIRQGQTLGQAGQTDEQRAAEEQAAYDGTLGSSMRRRRRRRRRMRRMTLA